MTQTLTLEQRRTRIENIAKVIGIVALGFLFAPIAIMTIKGVISLIIVGAIGFATVNIGIPWFSRSVANWRLKAIKAVAAANPIETLENRYAQLKDALLKQRENIKQRIAIAMKIMEQIKTFESQFNKPSPRREQYNKLNQLVELSKAKYEAAQVNLVEFGKIIEEKRADWEIALSMAEANKLANVGEDFTSKLMQDTALTTIQNGLDMAFAELDAAVMDENVQKVLSGQSVEVKVIANTPKTKQLAAPSDLDFDFESVRDAEIVPVKSTKNKK